MQISERNKGNLVKLKKNLNKAAVTWKFEKKKNKNKQKSVCKKDFPFFFIAAESFFFFFLAKKKNKQTFKQFKFKICNKQVTFLLTIKKKKEKKMWSSLFSLPCYNLFFFFPVTYLGKNSSSFFDNFVLGFFKKKEKTKNNNKKILKKKKNTPELEFAARRLYFVFENSYCHKNYNLF